VFLVGACALTQLSWAQEWLPIDQRELQLTSEPNAPGAPAVYLYRQVDRSDANFNQTSYFRIKILSEEGLKYANVEIPFEQRFESVERIRARTIHPDGSSVDFDGKVYEKPIVKARGAQLMEKTFTLPDVQVGSIIEYRYNHSRRQGWVYDSHWLLSEQLFTERAKFSLEVNPHLSVQWSWPRGLPEGTAPPKMERGVIRLEAHNIPAFVEEESMPPENEMRLRVDFIYDAQPFGSDPDTFWKDRGKRLYRVVQSFIGSPRMMAQAVAQVVDPADAPEVKLRKLYARISQIHNLNYEINPAEEGKEQKPESTRNVDDVWQKGSGDGSQIVWLFLALVRAAGLEADPVIVSSRDRYFFSRKVMNTSQLNYSLVLVKLDGKELYLAPGTPFTPYGLLPWWATGIDGLRLTKDGGSWITTPLPQPEESRIERKASLKFDRGTVAGKLTVTYTGLEAQWRRLPLLGQDATARKEYLEGDVQQAIPTGINVTLTNTPDWSDWSAPLVAQYDLEVPGWGNTAGRRVLLPMGLFGGEEKQIFQHASRVQPLYFAYPCRHFDDVTIELPAPWAVEALPKSRDADLKRMLYKSTADSRGRMLHFTRELESNVMYLDVEAYDTVRRFYQMVRAGDQDRAVLSLDAPAR